ncbi:MAG: IS91 family transposase [Polyangiaceae bacterium]|nr:IS91 family transposase [Polyangiaceae bacterium]
MAARPASAGRPHFDIADIVRQHRDALEAEVHLTLAQLRVLSAIGLCRTAALGGHVDVCRACGYEHPSYNSCRNRHCPKCQALAQERWIAARSKRLLDVPHFHVVFTLPGELRALARYRPRAIFDALFTAASETLLDLGDSRLGARPGVTAVLHTWTRDLRFHPHVHAIVTAGGLATDSSRWVASSTKYLFPVKVMGELLRGKMLDALRRLHADGAFRGFDAFDDPEGFERLATRLARVRWHVYAKKPFRKVLHVLRYLGRYTHRVAISSSRLVAITHDAVTFRTKNGKTVTLTPVEFLRRFIQHVLPDGLHKIRHYGLYAGVNAHALPSLAAATLQPASMSPPRRGPSCFWPSPDAT